MITISIEDRASEPLRAKLAKLKDRSDLHANLALAVEQSVKNAKTKNGKNGVRLEWR